MISSSILELILNKYVLGSIGAVIALIIAYYKGSSAATKAAEDEALRAEAARQSRLRAAEAKNQFLEKKGEQANEKVDASDTIDQLIKLWDEIQSGKGPSGPTRKDS